MRRLAAPVLAALLAALPAAAQTRPPSHPARDVAVTYLVTLPGGGQQADQATARMMYAAAGERMRVETRLLPFGGVVILDFARRVVSMVAPEQRRYLQTALPAGAAPNLPPDLAGARFQRGGQSRVAGLACTEWSTQGGSGCVTADGVVLSASYDHPRVRILALQVEYGAQPAALFAPPPDFERLALPRLPNLPNLPGMPGMRP
jgi:hypothetical protein